MRHKHSESDVFSYRRRDINACAGLLEELLGLHGEIEIVLYITLNRFFWRYFSPKSLLHILDQCIPLRGSKNMVDDVFVGFFQFLGRLAASGDDSQGRCSFIGLKEA